MGRTYDGLIRIGNLKKNSIKEAWRVGLSDMVPFDNLTWEIAED